MKIVVIRENFLKAVSLVGQVIAPRLNLPVLGNFLFTAERGFLETVATNLETTISYKIPVRVETPGKITTPAKILIDFCQAASGEQIKLTGEKDTLLVQSGEAEARLPTINPSEFPSVSEFQSGASLEIEREKFLQGISAVAFSASPEEGRPILTGLLLSAGGGKLSLVATDGYRLAKKELKIKGALEAIIPARTLAEAAKIIAEQEDDLVEIAVNKEKNQAQLQTKNLLINSRLLEGSYPTYEQIIPNSFICQATANLKELANAVKLASLFARELGSVVRLEAGEDRIKVSASTAQVGEAEASVAAKIVGEKLKVAFNSRFLLECLVAATSEQVTLSLSGVTSAALIRGSQESGLIHVVMPVRIQS